MSGRKMVNMAYHWGGIVVEDNMLGILYNGGQQGYIRVRMDTNYNNLIRKMHEKTGIDRTVEKLVLSCKFPTFIGSNATNCTYMRMMVDDDDTVEVMLSVVVEHPQLSVVNLFIETVPTNLHRIENNPPHVRNSFPQFDLNEQPSSSYIPTQFQSGSSSHYQDPAYVVPTQQSLDQSHPTPIPQSPFVVVAEFLQQTYIDESTDVEDNVSDCSDDEEMAHVESELEALGGDVEGVTGDADTDDEETAAPRRLYTPMEYYTTPQVDIFGEGYDWQTPPDFRNRCFFYPKKDQLKLGLLFRSKEELQMAVKLYNINAKREFKTKKIKHQCMGSGMLEC